MTALTGAIINVIIYIILAIIVLRIFFSIKRMEQMLRRAQVYHIEDEKRRAQHMKLMKIELEALNREKMHLGEQIEKCRSQLVAERIMNKDEGGEE